MNDSASNPYSIPFISIEPIDIGIVFSSMFTWKYIEVERILADILGDIKIIKRHPITIIRRFILEKQMLERFINIFLEHLVSPRLYLLEVIHRISFGKHCFQLHHLRKLQLS